MHHKHILLALIMALIWGANFSIMKIGLQGNSPFLFSAFRSILVLPLLFFIPRPKLPWRYLILIGALIGVFKLPLMLYAIYLGVPPGISSLLGQTQVLFTILLGILFFKDHPKTHNWIGMFIAFIGISLITIKLENTSTSTLGILVIFVSALSWALSNILTRKHKEVDMVHLTAWMNIVPPIPLIIVTGFFEGWEMVTYPFYNFSWLTFGAILYASFLAGLFGYSCWGYLLKHYPPSLVAPFSLLVPVFSIAVANIVLGEELTTVSLIGAVCVLAGLGINQLKFTGNISPTNLK